MENLFYLLAEQQAAYTQDRIKIGSCTKWKKKEKEKTTTPIISGFRENSESKIGYNDRKQGKNDLHKMIVQNRVEARGLTQLCYNTTC